MLETIYVIIAMMIVVTIVVLYIISNISLFASLAERMREKLCEVCEENGSVHINLKQGRIREGSVCVYVSGAIVVEDEVECTMFDMILGYEEGLYDPAPVSAAMRGDEDLNEVDCRPSWREDWGDGSHPSSFNKCTDLTKEVCHLPTIGLVFEEKRTPRKRPFMPHTGRPLVPNGEKPLNAPIMQVCDVDGCDAGVRTWRSLRANHVIEVMSSKCSDCEMAAEYEELAGWPTHSPTIRGLGTACATPW